MWKNQHKVVVILKWPESHTCICLFFFTNNLETAHMLVCWAPEKILWKVCFYVCLYHLYQSKNWNEWPTCFAKLLKLRVKRRAHMNIHLNFLPQIFRWILVWTGHSNTLLWVDLNRSTVVLGVSFGFKAFAASRDFPVCSHLWTASLSFLKEIKQNIPTALCCHRHLSQPGCWVVSAVPLPKGFCMCSKNFTFLSQLNLEPKQGWTLLRRHVKLSGCTGLYISDRGGTDETLFRFFFRQSWKPCHFPSIS